MRRGIITLLCIAGLMLWGVTAANAQSTVVWNMLDNVGAIAGNSPGADARVGTGDDGTDNCNFLPDTANCSGASPTVGSYSVNRVDFKPDPREECFVTSPLPQTTGTPCLCNDGSTICHPGAETCPDVSGPCGTTPGDCCGALPCDTCDDVSDSYFGTGTTFPNPGTLTTCNDSLGYIAIDFDVATTETLAGTGGGCLKLYTLGDDTGTPCPNPAAATAVTGTIDVAVGALGLCPPGGVFQVNDVAYGGGGAVDGNIFPSGSPPASICGYSGGSLTALVNAAVSAAGGACNIMILCGTTTLPASGGISNLPCYSNADVQFTTVAWTTDSWTCTGTCPQRP
jgi:hypothetical protein